MNEDIQEQDGGFDRRSLIKRAAVVGAATAWATPTIQSITAPAFATGTPAGGCTARMTGGGRVLTVTGSAVTFNGQEIPFMSFGLGQIICTPPPTPDYTQIEVNAHSQGNQQADHSYHFTISTITCSKVDPNPAPGPNTAKCANVFTGTAVDEDGNTLEFKLEDHGEGQNMDLDLGYFSINGGATLYANGNVENGNLQVHDNIPGVQRDCSGC